MTPPMAQQPLHVIQTHHEYPSYNQQPQGNYIPPQGYQPYPDSSQQPHWNPPQRQQPLPRIQERNGRNNQPPQNASCQVMTYNTFS